MRCKQFNMGANLSPRLLNCYTAHTLITVVMSHTCFLAIKIQAFVSCIIIKDDKEAAEHDAITLK